MAAPVQDLAPKFLAPVSKATFIALVPLCRALHCTCDTGTCEGDSAIGPSAFPYVKAPEKGWMMPKFCLPPPPKVMPKPCPRDPPRAKLHLAAGQRTMPIMATTSKATKSYITKPITKPKPKVYLKPGIRL